MAALATLALTLGCARTAREAARQGAPAAVEGSLDKVEQPPTRARIAEVLEDPHLLDSTSHLSAAVADGVVQSVTGPDSQARLQQATERLVVEASPAVARALDETIDASLDRALAPGMEERIEDLVAAATRSTLQGLGRELVDGQGRPAPALSHATGHLVRGLTREAALGLDDAVRKAQQEAGAGNTRDAGLLALAGESAHLVLGGTRALVWSPVLLALAALAAVTTLLTLALILLQRYRSRSRAHTEAVLALARAIKSTENARWAGELRDHLRDTVRNTEGGEELRKLLRDHADLWFAPAAPASHTAPSVKQ